jgi:general secretion pathway protein G
MLQYIKQSHIARMTQKGFTLIELLMVIVILGVLAGIVVFAVNGIQDRGVSASCRSDKKNVEIAQEAYNAQNNLYAGSVAALVTANLLRESPATVHYTIATSNTGAVSVAAGTVDGPPAGC